METNDTSKYLPVAVIAAGLLIAGAVMWNGSRDGSAVQPGTQGGAAPTVDISKIAMAGDPFIGKADAPLTIIEWSDFQCPFCKNAELGTMSEIVKNYVDTGKVKVVFMDFAFLGPDSITAAKYNRAVWKLYPSQYFAWREAMYTAQDDENGGFGDVASVDALTATISGIDAAKVAADVKENGGTYQAEIDADKSEATKVGINATPSFVIGNQVMQGALPYASFQAAIDSQLK